jgi:hypothetical protein
LKDHTLFGRTPVDSARHWLASPVFGCLQWQAERQLKSAETAAKTRCRDDDDWWIWLIRLIRLIWWMLDLSESGGLQGVSGT